VRPLADRRGVGPVNSNGGTIPLTGGVLVIPPGPCVTCNVQMSANTEWLSSVRGRLGFAGWNNTLFYATGGVAWANIEYAAIFNTGIFPSNTSFNTTKTGWVAGAGAEWMATLNITIRAEYLFYDIASANVSASAPICPPGAGRAIIPFVYNWSSYNVQVARIAASYKF